MKRILFLFTASLLFLACSNDDNGPDESQQLKIKQFRQNFFLEDSSENYTLERLFDATGQTVRENTIYIDLSFYWLYTYNSFDLVTEKNNFYNDGAKRRIDTFSYDSNQRVDSIAFKNGIGEVMSVRIYTKESDKITFQQSSIYGEIYYNAEGRIIKNYISGDTGTSTQTIEYSGDNITMINLNHSNGYVETYTFEYDEGLNPLYDYVQNNYSNATNGDHISFFDRHNYFSKNNYTRVIYNSSAPNSDYIKTKATVYNADGYPISAVVNKNDVLFEELTYDYY